MKLRPNFVIAWIFLTVSLTLHVIDEALHDFLDLYNPLVSSLNQNINYSLFPIFSFSGWLTGLTIGIITLFGLTPFAIRRKKWILYLAYPYAILMIMNSLGHFAGSIYFSKPIAGVYSSPLLMVGSLYLLWSSNHALKSRLKRKGNN